ncbi:MAG: PEP-CTERM sorting domain-containing protein [Anaerohalosphaera sp.]|nr:PEP-CTERM sorting domain-containing protein [Anaerohalosphaera sp.]
MKAVIILAVVAVALTAGIVNGGLIAYEGFDGTAGSDVDTTGSGTGWAGTWSKSTTTAAAFVYEDPGLVHKTLDVTGLSATFKGNGGGTARYSRSLASAVTLDTAGDEVWVSYILDMKEVQAGRGFGIELTSAGTSVAAFGKGINKSSGLGTKFTSDWVNVGNPSGVKLLMLQLSFDGTDTTATMYIDGSATAPLGSASATGSITIAGSITIDGVNLFGYHSSTLDNTLDEIRIGDTQADVIVPEPATLALLGLGCIGIIRRRKA